MADDAFAGLAPLPPSIAEWEDVLVRLEIAPRALRATLEDVPADHPGVRERLAEAAARERVWQRVMEALREGDPVLDARPVPAPGRDGRTDAEAMAELFTSLRMRTFAMAQRRGVDVWEWETTLPDGTVVTPYRLFTRMVRDDAQLLAALRGAAGGAAC